MAFKGQDMITATARTLVASDDGLVLRFTAATAVTVTVDTDANRGYVANQEVFLIQEGAGAVTVAAAGGVTVTGLDSDLTLAGQWAAATLVRVASNTWRFSGHAPEVLKDDADASGFGFVVDEDNMASDSATKVPTQQSVKAYVDGAASGLTEIVQDTTPQLGGDLDLNGNGIDFPTTPNITDVLDEDNMASDSATALATQQSIKAYVDGQASGISNVVEDTTPQLGGNLDANGNTITGLDASTTAKGIVELATNTEVDTGTDTARAVTPDALANSALQSKVDGIETGADVTDATNVDAAGAVMEADFDANTILAANSDNTPAALTVAEQRIVGRITAGNITGLTAAQAKTLLAIVEADISDLGAYLENVSEDTTPSLGGELDAATFGIVNLGAVREQVTTVATTGATETWALGVNDDTMDEACTFSFPGSLTSGDLHTVVAIIRGAFTPTLPGSIDWADGAAPTYASPSLYVFATVDGGTTWLGTGRVGFA